MIAVCDTGPLNYLVLIDAADILGTLFETVSLPQEVFQELHHRKAPAEISAWLKQPPAWLHVPEPPAVEESSVTEPLLAEGRMASADLACIKLAQSLENCILIMDDRFAKEVAIARGVRTSGTLALLFEAGAHGLLDFGAALDRLEQTTFRASVPLRRQYRHRWEQLRDSKP